ncbi:MAG: maleylpyruvate isomerase family mycothiol-dependent enzyme [Micromonosporaceae bacterium]
MRHDHRRTREWVRTGTDLFLRQLDGLSDPDLALPSRLPGWSRAHLAGHLARNAEALTRLVHWADTGVETPMYASPEQRATEIEQSAQLPPPELRDDVRATARRLDQAMATLDTPASRGAANPWDAEVRSAKGRLIPAAEIPWMRVREVWLHAVDLGTGVTAADLPAELVDCLLDDVTGGFAGREDVPALVLTATDRARTWRVPGEDPIAVSGSAAVLAGWLVGRDDGRDLQVAGRLPTIPPWL